MHVQVNGIASQNKKMTAFSPSLSEIIPWLRWFFHVMYLPEPSTTFGLFFSCAAEQRRVWVDFFI